jgi:hypothetical protein
MTHQGRLVSTVAVAVLVAVLAASPASAGKTDRIHVGGSTPSPSGGSEDVLIDDDFSAENWNVVTDDRKSITYRGDALNVQVFKPEYFVWTRPNSDTYRDVHIEATMVNNTGSDDQTAFGFICDQQTDNSDNFYYFAVTPTGDYAIARAVKDKDDVVLSNNNKWATSDLIAKNAASYRVAADCAEGQLTLYVDGNQIASVSDSTYTEGSVGLLVWSDTDATKTDALIDDFRLTQLH